MHADRPAVMHADRPAVMHADRQGKRLTSHHFPAFNKMTNQIYTHTPLHLTYLHAGKQSCERHKYLDPSQLKHMYIYHILQTHSTNTHTLHHMIGMLQTHKCYIEFKVVKRD